MSHRIAFLTGLYATCGGFVSVAGWVLDVRRLADWDDDGISIQPNAALCVLFSGAGVLSLAAKRHRWATVCGTVALLIGGLTLFEWISGLSFGFDSLLLFGREWGRAGVVAPGRMGPPGSFSWTLIGAAIVLSSASARFRRWAPALALATMAVSALSLIGYLYGVNQLYALPYFTVIALQTSTFIMALSVGIIVVHRDREPMRTLLDSGGAGMLARRALPVVVVVPIIVGFLRVKGQNAGLFDTGMGSAWTTLILIGFLAGIQWPVILAVRAREQALRESEARGHERAALLQTILDTSPSPIWVSLDPRCERIVGNPAAEALLGVPHEANVSLSAAAEARHRYRCLRDGEEVPAEMLPMQRAAREGVVVHAEEYEIVRGDGTRVWLLMHASPLIRDGRCCGGIAIGVDITERKLAETAVRQADRRKDEFLATLAHELRNPLAPIRNALQLMQMQGPAVPESQWARDIIERQIQQMTRLVDDLMDVSRISRGKIELRRERIELEAVIQGAIETSRPLIEHSGHELTVHLPSQTAYLDADWTRLAQVFSNLLNNAAKYTEPGGTIRLTAECQGSEAVVAVKDSGIGIPRESLHQVFEMFSQVQGALERSQGGLGIGLSLVKRLVEMHGGTIEARSEGPRKGSEFVVRLPLVLEQADAAPGPIRESCDSPAPSFRILIVDDNRDAADSLAMMLRLTGHEIRTVYDGEAALRDADDFRPHVILLDIGLPKLSGYDACRFIRTRPWGADPMLIAMTGWGQDEDKRNAHEAGFDRHFVKPVDPHELIRLLSFLPVDPAGKPGDRRCRAADKVASHLGE